MNDLILENKDQNCFFMICRFQHQTSKKNIYVKEQYKGGIIILTEHQTKKIQRKDTYCEINEWKDLQDLGDLCSREFLGIDELEKLPGFVDFFPLLDELENFDIANFEMIEWFKAIGFIEISTTYQINGEIQIKPFNEKSRKDIRIKSNKKIRSLNL